MKKDSKTPIGHGRGEATKEGGGKMTIAEATELWNKKYPDTKVTQQTIRNWAAKYAFGSKSSWFPRSKWKISKEAFNEFLENPKKFIIHVKEIPEAVRVSARKGGKGK